MCMFYNFIYLLEKVDFGTDVHIVVTIHAYNVNDKCSIASYFTRDFVTENGKVQSLSIYKVCLLE